MNGSDLPNGWAVQELDSLRAKGEHTFVGGPFGSDLTSKDYVQEPGIPVIRGTNLGGNESRFIDDGFVYVSARKADALRRNMAFPGDVVFTVEYSVRVAQMAVYELLHIDREIPPIKPHDKSLRTQISAVIKAFK